MLKRLRNDMAISYKKKYLKHFGYGEQDFIQCENCSASCSDVHHLKFRSLGGDDKIENLMGLCRTCHDKAHNEPDYNEYLKHIHMKRLTQLKSKL